jgi:lysozyme family protein
MRGIMSDTFATAFRNLLGWEGGYGNNAKDPGGPTSLGVIQTEYDAYRKGKGIPAQSVRNITLAEAEEIYRNQYWDATNCGQLNAGVADATFDASVNSGPHRGVTWLQEAINQVAGRQVVSVDGACGPLTIAAANALEPGKLIDSMLTFRLAFMKIARNPKTGALLWPTFGKGWQPRINGVRVQAHKLAGISPNTETLSTALPHPAVAASGPACPAGGAVPFEPDSKEKTMTTLPASTTSVVAAATQSATLSLSSIVSSITGLFSSVAVGGVLTVISTLAPNLTGEILAIAGVLAAIVSAIAHAYAVFMHVNATNNATIALVENFINTTVTEFGGKAFDFPNDPAAA